MFERSLKAVLGAGREILKKRRQRARRRSGDIPLITLCRELLDHRGEASGLALASEITRAYRGLDHSERVEFFQQLAEHFSVDAQQILAAAEQYREHPDEPSLRRLTASVEAPRARLFRRINMAPDGTATLVMLRGHLLPLLERYPDLRAVDADLKNLFIAWFNKGFLELREVNWLSPAAVLEKLIAYEAVHAITDWGDLRARLAPDRRCYAFFHPALPDDPLVFVEIALTQSTPGAIAPLIDKHRQEVDTGSATTVVFYSISNCHKGLSGVSFGNFLIKTVIEELRRDLPWLKTFVTLSPVPGFRAWLQQTDLGGLVSKRLIEAVRQPIEPMLSHDIYQAQLKLCAHYLLKAKAGILPLDKVARFHLGNGAQLHQLHGGADQSENGRARSGGIMVNYLYDLDRIEMNHDAFFDEGLIAVARDVSQLLR